jgi:hypothetical protein
MKYLFGILLIGMTALTAGCGYTTGSLLPSHYKGIFVAPVANKVDYMNQDQRSLYVPGMETRVRTALIDRYAFDGNLRPAARDEADMELDVQLTGFDRDELQLTTSSDVKEYRIRIRVAMTMVDRADKDNVLWEEKSFAGEATYFTTGPQARSESAAIDDCLKDLAMRVVARTIEDW